MFENRSTKERIIIYLVIAVIVAGILSIIHYFQGYSYFYIVPAAIIEFLCIFYILYLPLKAKEKQKK